ncbi:MAG TPA: hypothetical protein VFD27_17410 [Chthoniobacteraceae bacterium]|jgi:hypothetical protein|nr:hypothetical protein [Chthoniobacteraceae bacterium]
MNANAKFSRKILLSSFALATVVLLPSCAVDSEGRPEYCCRVNYGEGVCAELPADFIGSYYYYKGYYYYGGRHEIGNFYWHARRYDHRYYHAGRYYYGGQYYRGRDYYRGAYYAGT